MNRIESRARFRQREELLDFLLEVTSLVSETLDLDTLLSTVANLIKRAVPADIFAILLYHEKSKSLRIRYSIGHRPEIVRNLEVQLGEGITGLAAQTKKPLRVDDVRKDTRYLNSLDPVRSELAVPMMADGRLVGVIDIESTDVGTYSNEDQALISLIASRVAYAIDHARMHRRMERNNRTLRTLSTLAQEFSSILDLDHLLSRIAISVRSLMDFDAFSIFLVEGNLLKHHFSQRYDKRVEANNILIGTGITGHAVALREPILVRDTLLDQRYLSTHADIRSEIATPLIVKDRVIGVLDLESDRIGHFTEDHKQTLSLLAPQIAIAIDNARLYEEVENRRREMEDDLLAASRLQRIIMPGEAPEISGLEIGVGARPAREVSGDIYDFFEHSQDYAMIAFGDSSGKGAAAALYGAMVSGLLRSIGHRRRGPAVLLRTLNELLMERQVAAQYATLLGILWRASNKTLTIANAGGIPPFIIRKKKIIQPKIAGVPIGLLEERDYEETDVHLKSGDVVIIISDGFQDQRNDQGIPYGDQAFPELLPALATLSSKEIVAKLFEHLDEYRGTRLLEDDQTIIVLKVK